VKSTPLAKSKSLAKPIKVLYGVGNARVSLSPEHLFYFEGGRQGSGYTLRPLDEDLRRFYATFDEWWNELRKEIVEFNYAEARAIRNLRADDWTNADLEFYVKSTRYTGFLHLLLLFLLALRFLPSLQTKLRDAYFKQLTLGKAEALRDPDGPGAVR
jgi:hypothetical protein